MNHSRHTIGPLPFFLTFFHPPPLPFSGDETRQLSPYAGLFDTPAAKIDDSVTLFLEKKGGFRPPKKDRGYSNAGNFQPATSLSFSTIVETSKGFSMIQAAERNIDSSSL